jgi:hypothetical protein
VTVSVGWLGAAAAYIALAITGITSVDAQQAHAAYLSLELIGWLVIVPASLASLLTGLVQLLGTEWGLFRHYWVSAKFLLTSVATLILLGQMPAVSHLSGLAAAGTTSSSGKAGVDADVVGLVGQHRPTIVDRGFDAEPQVECLTVEEMAQHVAEFADLGTKLLVLRVLGEPRPHIRPAWCPRPSYDYASRGQRVAIIYLLKGTNMGTSFW